MHIHTDSKFPAHFVGCDLGLESCNGPTMWVVRRTFASCRVWTNILSKFRNCCQMTREWHSWVAEVRSMLHRQWINITTSGHQHEMRKNRPFKVQLFTCSFVHSRNQSVVAKTFLLNYYLSFSKEFFFRDCYQVTYSVSNRTYSNTPSLPMHFLWAIWVTSNFASGAFPSTCLPHDNCDSVG